MFGFGPSTTIFKKEHIGGMAMANPMSHLGVFLSTMETQLDKTTETLSTIVTAKVSLSKISALIDIL